MINKIKSWLNRDSVKSATMSIGDVVSMTRSGVDPMKIEAVWSCIRDKSETAGMLPIKLYDVKGEANVPIEDGRTWRIFTQQPCDYMTMQEFIEFGVFWLERTGAFYAYKAKNDRGVVNQIIPFRYQANVQPNYDINGQVYYTYTTNDGKGVTNYRLEDLFIIKGMSFDGITPISPLQYQANLLGIANAQQENYRELQDNGITSQMALSTDNVFNDRTALTRLQDDWKKYRGKGGVSAVPVFENGIKPVSLKLTPQESELLGHQEFTVNRIARLFRVPLHRIGASEGSEGDTGNIFDLDEAYLRNNINPILCKFEAQFNKILGSNHKVVFNRKSYYAGSPYRIGEAVDKLVKGGLVSINEGRRDLAYDPIDGADVFAVDNNNVLYSTWDNLKEAQELMYNRSNNQQTSETDAQSDVESEDE